MQQGTKRNSKKEEDIKVFADPKEMIPRVDVLKVEGFPMELSLHRNGRLKVL